MICKGDGFYRLLLALGRKDLAREYLKNLETIDELMEKRRNFYKPIAPDKRTFSEN